ncbi:hypothetical protein CLOM_g16744 [Closterium sp. NIES-68]|nr:hypothetical protein CLOM_g16744 [Closterium sp. NIES-68]GJP85589.1 hypothetical protein CLOP_g15694 [Closterium sp. NIES-67]
MSGWDEGQVFYSNQSFPESEGAAGDDALGDAGVTRYAAQKKLREFVRNFHDPQYHDRFIYRERLQEGGGVLEVDLEDLASKEEGLCRLMRTRPADVLPLLEVAAAEVAASIRQKVMAESGELEDARVPPVQVLLKSSEDAMPIRALTAAHISHLVKISGIVIASSRAKAKATSVVLMCRSCKNVKAIPCRPGLGGAIIPRTCDRTPQPGEEPCGIDPWVVLPDRSEYVDQQTLKLQENPEDVPTGEMPRSVLLAVDRSLVQRISPGTRITVFGIFSIFQSADKAKSRGAMAIAIRQPYLRVVGVEMASDGAARSNASSFTTDEEAEFKDFSRQNDVYGAISSQIAPSIFGHADIKKAIACLLFGGARKLLPDGARLRGDINVLLIGDPSTAKSQFLKFVEKTAPIAVYTSGKGSSAAGLTASVIRDASSREFYLEGGAMVLADGGVVCIDEFDKMRPEDRVAIHEAMEQQTISIAKAGITTVLNSRTSVLAAANPPSGRYDDLKTAQENIDLQSTILSRFDLIFVVKDTRDFNRDLQIARHVVNVHARADAVVARGDEGMGDGPAGAGGVGHTGKDGEQENWLKRYIEFARSRCSPRLSESAATLLQNSYVQIRQNMRRRATETGEASALPITVRQLEAIVRLSESMARMQLSPVATEEHVTEALRLFHVATLDAARSGVMDGAVLTDEQRREVQQVEGAVRRRVAIGGFVSERRLLDDITRSGISESAVRRALLIMVARGEVEYRRERRVIYRKV